MSATWLLVYCPALASPNDRHTQQEVDLDLTLALIKMQLYVLNRKCARSL